MRTASWPWVFDDKRVYLIFNVAVGGTLGGQVSPEDLPATLVLPEFVSIPGTAVQRVSPPRSQRPTLVNSLKYLRCSPDSETPVRPQSSGP